MTQIQIQAQIDSIKNRLIRKYKPQKIIRNILPKDRPFDLIVLTPLEYQEARMENALLLEIEAKGRVL